MLQSNKDEGWGIYKLCHGLMMDFLIINNHLNKVYPHSIPSSLCYYILLAVNNQKCNDWELAREEELVGNLICLKMISQTDKNESESCQTCQSQIQHIKINLYPGSSCDHDSLAQEPCCFQHCLRLLHICNFDNDLN